MEAMLYEKLEEDKVKCYLCNHNCLIKEGKRGICGVRENRSGTLKTLAYGLLIADNIDPIEKKPLFHFMPGTISYSIATVGCNFRCLFCQNASIAQLPADRNGMITGEPATPEEIVNAAVSRNCASISYTYTEPTIYFEYAYDTAKLAHNRGLKNVFVTNGYMSKEALDKIEPYLDAANCDLKAFTPEFYKTYCGAKLEPVKENLVRMKEKGIFLEVTTLIIPGLNDDQKELEALAVFIAESLGTDTPWHVSRFHPTYKLTDRPSTPVKTLTTALDIGKNAGLKYVYVGNAPGTDGEHTICPSCGETVIRRWGFQISQMNMENGKCKKCGETIDGVFA
jgi:pyruvate formate lyase activating enzyme